MEIHWDETSRIHERPLYGAQLCLHFRPLVGIKGKPALLPPLQTEHDTNCMVTDFTIPVLNHCLDDSAESGDHFEQNSENSDIRNKIPANAQATTVMVGAHGQLSCTVSAFVRLAGGCDLGNFAEVNIPVRFMFVLLGPEDDSIDYHEVGRSISTLMSDKIFLQSAYEAKVCMSRTNGGGLAIQCQCVFRTF